MTDPRPSPEELQEKFEFFLFEMDDVLEPFMENARKRGLTLDYSLESLADLERLLTELAEEAASPDETSLLVTRAGRYLGEFFRKRYGGVWRVCLAGPKYLHHGLPVIKNYATVELEFAPTEIVDNFVVRRVPGLLRRAVEQEEPWVKR